MSGTTESPAIESASMCYSLTLRTTRPGESHRSFHDIGTRESTTTRAAVETTVVRCALPLGAQPPSSRRRPEPLDARAGLDCPTPPGWGTLLPDRGGRPDPQRTQPDRRGVEDWPLWTTVTRFLQSRTHWAGPGGSQTMAESAPASGWCWPRKARPSRRA